MGVLALLEDEEMWMDSHHGYTTDGEYVYLFAARTEFPSSSESFFYLSSSSAEAKNDIQVLPTFFSLEPLISCGVFSEKRGTDLRPPQPP